MIGRKKDITSGSVPRFPAKPKLANSSRTLDLPKTSLFIALFCSAMAHAQKQIPIEQKEMPGSEQEAEAEQGLRVRVTVNVT